MNFLIGLCNDDVGTNVSSHISSLFELKEYDKFENQIVYCSQCDKNKLFFVKLETMIDENSKQRVELQKKLDLDALIMVAWHQGSEKNCLILRAAGEKINISKTDVNLSNFLAKEIFSVANTNNQSYYLEATHGPELFYSVPFLVLEIGGDEEDWNNSLLGSSVAQILSSLKRYTYEKESEPGYYYIAFGNSHCSKTLIKKCCQAGIVHYFSGQNVHKYADFEVIEKIKLSNKQQNLLCKLLVHKRLNADIKNKLIPIADKLHLEIEYYK